MSSYVEWLLEKYKTKGLLIDANLLLLYLVGSCNLRLIGDGRYDKLSKYVVEDFRLLLRLKAVFRNTVTTPHVLTEVSNLAGDLPESTKIDCLKEFIPVLKDVDELMMSSFEAAGRSEFPFLGLTDSVLAQLSQRFLIVTDDARLVGRLNQSGLNALNFNHLRTHLLA